MVRINIDIDEETHTKAKVISAKKNCTLINFYIEAIKEKVKKEDK